VRCVAVLTPGSYRSQRVRQPQPTLDGRPGRREICAHPCHHRLRRGIRQDRRVHYLGPVDNNAQLPEAAPLSVDVERWICAKLCRHPGGNEGFAGSDRAVVDLDAAHQSSLQVLRRSNIDLTSELRCNRIRQERAAQPSAIRSPLARCSVRQAEATGEPPCRYACHSMDSHRPRPLAMSVRCYSARKATAGSTRAARLAGSQLARQAVATSTTVAADSVSGSAAVTP